MAKRRTKRILATKNQTTRSLQMGMQKQTIQRVLMSHGVQRLLIETQKRRSQRRNQRRK